MEILLYNTPSGLKPCYDEDYDEKKKLKMNKYCMNCRKAHIGLNGPYCMLLRKLVQYAQTPPCKNEEYRPQRQTR